MGIKTVGRIAAWGMAGAVLGALVWQRLALGFGALWLVPLAWGATSVPLEAGALMAGYYGAALSGSIVAITLFEGPWAGVPGWATCTALLAAPWALARAGHAGRRFPRAGAPLRYLATLVVVSLPPLGAIGMASPWVAATASFPDTGVLGLGLAAVASAVLVIFGARVRAAVGLRPFGEWSLDRWAAAGAAVSLVLMAGTLLSPPKPHLPASFVAITTHNRESAGPPPLARVLRQNRELIARLSVDIAHKPPHTTFILPEDAVVHWSPFTASAWWPLALKAYRHHDTVALGVYMRPVGDTEKRDALLLMGRHAGLVTARQPMPLTEWRPLPDSGTRAHWMRLGPTRAFGPPVAVLICYEQLLVWPVAEDFLGSTRPQVLIGVSDHWWVEPGTLDATEARMQAQVLRAWGRLYGVPVILADNRPYGLAYRKTVKRQDSVVRPNVHQKSSTIDGLNHNPDKVRTKYGQNTDKPEKTWWLDPLAPLWI